MKGSASTWLERNRGENTENQEKANLNNCADKLLYLDSPALRVFRDFKKHKAITVAMDMPIRHVPK